MKDEQTRQKLASRANEYYPLGIPKNKDDVRVWLQDLAEDDHAHADIFETIHDLMKRKD